MRPSAVLEAPENTITSIPREGCHLPGLSILAVQRGERELGYWGLTPFLRQAGGSRNSGGVSECASSWLQTQAARADKAKSPPTSAVTLSKQSRCLQRRTTLSCGLGSRVPLHVPEALGVPRAPRKGKWQENSSQSEQNHLAKPCLHPTQPGSRFH